jgi:HTH domain
MSVLDEFRAAEQRVSERMRELRPLVNEYRDLEQLAQRVGLAVDADASAEANGGSQSDERPQPRRPRPSTRRGRETAGGKRATRPIGQAHSGASTSPNRREDIVRLVQQRPGITVRELGSELGVDPTGLYKPVHRLQADGAIVKQGAKLTPPDGVGA